MSRKNPSTPDKQKEPNSKIAELYGRAPEVYKDEVRRLEVVRNCPFRETLCDVSANRNRVAYIDLNHAGVSSQEKQAIESIYGKDVLPLGICSSWTKRQNENTAKP